MRPRARAVCACTCVHPWAAWACVNRKHHKYVLLLSSPDCATHACTVSSILSGEVGSKGMDRWTTRGMLLITVHVFAAKPGMARLASPSRRVSWVHPDSSGVRPDRIAKTERLMSALVSAGTWNSPLHLPRASVAWPVAKTTLSLPCRPTRDNHRLQGVSRFERQLLPRHRPTRILRGSFAMSSRHSKATFDSGPVLLVTTIVTTYESAKHAHPAGRHPEGAYAALMSPLKCLPPFDSTRHETVHDGGDTEKATAVPSAREVSTSKRVKKVAAACCRPICLQAMLQ